MTFKLHLSKIEIIAFWWKCPHGKALCDDCSQGTGTKNDEKNGLEQGIDDESKEEMESMEEFPETETLEEI